MAPRNLACVVCPPLGYEAIQCYHTLRLLAQELAASGFHTVRVDYVGFGESLGNHSDPGQVDAWLDSIRQAAQALESLPEVDAVALLGLRMGATLAARVAAEMDVAKLVLWNPCISGRRYARELEMVASASLGALLATGDASARTTLGLEAAGYVLAEETLDHLSRLGFEGLQPRGCPEVLFIGREDQPHDPRIASGFESVGCPVTVVRMPGYREMMVRPALSRVPTAIVVQIRDWLLRDSRFSESQPGSLPLRADAADGAIRHRVIRFGPSDRLFGVVTAPEPAGTTPTSTVVLLSGGVVPRTAVNRMYVSLAQRLAELGHVVIRMDVSGVCESVPGPEAAWGDPFTPALIDDTRSALTWALGNDLPSDVWLIGLCSGAYAAYQSALVESRVVGMVLINPLLLYWEPGVAATAPAAHEFRGAHRIRRSVLSWSSWGQLLSGGTNVRHKGEVILARAKAWLASAMPRPHSLRASTDEPLEADLQQLLARGVSVNLAFSDGDPGFDAFVRQAGSGLPGLRQAGLNMECFPEADHTFNAMNVRGQLLDWTIDRVTSRS